MERNILVDFAGGFAERPYAPRTKWIRAMGNDGLRRNELYYADDDPPTYYVEIVRGTDLNHVNERLSYLGRYNDDAYRADLEARALALIRELWPAIQRVARALCKHKTLSQAQVRKLMTRARRGYPRAIPRGAAAQLGV